MSAPSKESLEKLYGAVARGYCHQKNSHKVLDGDLIEAIVAELLPLLVTRWMICWSVSEKPFNAEETRQGFATLEAATAELGRILEYSPVLQGKLEVRPVDAQMAYEREKGEIK